MPPRRWRRRDGDPGLSSHRHDPPGRRVHQHGAADVDGGDGLVASGVTTDEGGGRGIGPDVPLHHGDAGPSQPVAKRQAERAPGPPVQDDVHGVTGLLFVFVR